MDEDENTATTTQEVSVPYRGATFLNAFSMVSPYGVMPRFRPLSGSYISQSYPKLIILSYIYVSVPYRGATFLNQEKLTVNTWLISVSVPYRGATFLNIRNHSIGTLLVNSFRPLSGSYISQL